MRTRTLALVALILAASVARAQGTASAGADPELATRTRLKSDLRNLVTAQEAYYADHSSYADQIDNLKFKPSNGSQVSLVATQNNAWAAVASDPSWPGKSCVIYINLAEKYRPKTAQEKLVGTNKDEGKPMCDGD